MDKFMDGQVKLGATRYEHYAGSQRRIVNQMKPGTVSRHTLFNLLEKRLEQVLVCPVRKDDNF
jgi:ATP-dependent protease HslVU (ClpYQ) peptidase subunit